MIMTTTKRVLAVASAAVVVSGLCAVPAGAAETFKAPFDTDSLNRSVPSGKAYLKGTFSWQWQDSSAANRDQRASFSGRLYLQGAKNSCAHLKVTTYVGDALRDAGSKVEKHFPASGFFTYCQADGRGSAAIGGADIQDRSFTDIGTFKSARINVCYTKNRATPPSGDCYNFTVRPGD